MKHIDQRRRDGQFEVAALVRAEQLKGRARTDHEATRSLEGTHVHVERPLELVRLVGWEVARQVRPAPGEVEERLTIERPKWLVPEELAHRPAGDDLASQDHEVAHVDLFAGQSDNGRVASEHLESWAHCRRKVVRSRQPHLLKGVEPLGDTSVELTHHVVVEAVTFAPCRPTGEDH